MEQAKITDVTGIGPGTAGRLAAHGLRTVAALAAASLEEIRAVPGFGVARAAAVREAARRLLDPSPVPASAAPDSEKNAAKKDKKKKKDGDRKKDKKKKKKKKEDGKKKKKKKNKGGKAGKK